MSQSITLVIGNKNTSSWSLRAWLVLKHAGLPFAEQFVALRHPDTKENILKVSPSGHIPALRDGGLLIWDTLAIAEYVNETYAKGGLWPTDPAARALARAVSAEMHSGFAALRAEMPMDVAATDISVDPSADCRANINRIHHIWQDCRTRFGAQGPYLFGRWSIADAMFAPVVSRFQTYNVTGDELVENYCADVLDDPFFIEWRQACPD